MKTSKYVAVLAIVALVAGLWLSAPAYSQFQEDPNPGGGGSGSCYCGQTACGCSPPPNGCVLYYSCACSSIHCSRSCDYDCG